MIKYGRGSSGRWVCGFTNEIDKFKIFIFYLLFFLKAFTFVSIFDNKRNTCDVSDHQVQADEGIGFELWKSLNILEWGSYQLSHESTDSGQKLNKEAPLLLLSTRPPHSCTKKVYFFEFIVRVSAVVNCYFSHNLPHLIIMDFASGEQM